MVISYKKQQSTNVNRQYLVIANEIKHQGLFHVLRKYQATSEKDC